MPPADDALRSAQILVSVFHMLTVILQMKLEPYPHTTLLTLPGQRGLVSVMGVPPFRPHQVLYKAPLLDAATLDII